MSDKLETVKVVQWLPCFDILEGEVFGEYQERIAAMLVDHEPRNVAASMWSAINDAVSKAMPSSKELYAGLQATTEIETLRAALLEAEAVIADWQPRT